MQRLSTRPSRVFLVALVLFAVGATLLAGMRIAHAGYASGSGQGKYQNQIFWLDWSGFTFANGQQRTFTVPGGLTITAIVSNVSGGSVTIGRPEDYSPAAVNRAYPGTGNTAIKSCDACTNRFRITFSATIASNPVPVSLIVADAEAAAGNEYLKVTTDGNAWQLLEQFQAVNLDATWSNADKTLLLDGNGATTYGTALAISTGLTNLDFELKGGGISAAMLGVVVPVDYGDAPASYGDAGHFIQQVFSGGLPGSTKTYAPVSTTFTNFATFSDSPVVYLGAAKPDVDPGSRNTGADASTANGDDRTDDDEDGVATLPLLSTLASSYTVSVTVFNNSGSAANLSGWIDFNRNGVFDAGERRTVVVPSNAIAQPVALTWTSLAGIKSGPSYLRVRVSQAANTQPTGGLLDGEAEDYALTIRAPSTIRIVQSTTPPNGTNLAYTASGLPAGPLNFQLDNAVPDDADGVPQSRTLDSLRPGQYKITQQTLVGWGAPTITCTGSGLTNQPIVASPAVTVTVDWDSQVQCDFANNKLGSLTIVKQAPGDPATFTFTSTTLVSSTFSLNTISNTGAITFGNLGPGTYNVAEATPPTNWVAESASCSDGSPTSAIAIGIGEHVTCTFVNRQADTLVIIKRAIGGDATFAFTSTTNLAPSGAFSITTTSGQAIRTFAGLTPGAYSVSESVPTDWTLTTPDPVCSNGDSASSISLVAGQTVVCVFINLRNDTIVINKKAIGGDGVFAFTSTVPSATSFALTTTAGSATRALDDLTPATYAFAESVPSGWAQTGALCDNGDSPAAVSLAPGLNVTCTFTNTKLAELVVVKRAFGGDGSFAFTSTVPASTAFSVVTTGSVGTQHIANIAPGVYAVAETTPAGWVALSASCDDGSSPSAVQLDPGESVVCTFTNEKLGALVLGKLAVGGDATFTFTSTIPGATAFPVTTISETAVITLTGIPSGTYALAEQPLAGWDLLLSQCDVGSPDALTIASGQTVSCVLVNVKHGNLTLRKTAAGQDRQFTFSSQTLTPTTFSTTTVNGEGVIRFTDLSVLTTYDLTETVPSGWDLRSATCTGSSTPGAISIPPGGDVTCTFQNVERSSLTVVKRSVGGDGAFPFNSTLPGNASFTLNTTAGTASRTFADVVPAEYALTETVPAGWLQTGATCDNGNLPAAVQPAPGASVTCTFTNTRLLNLVVAKGGTGSGVVSSTPAGINCGVDCSEDYPFNTPVTLTATPAAGSIFAGWSGAGCSGTGNCVVTMNAARNVTATFAPAPPTLFALSVAVAGNGAGAVVSSPAGIDCGATCSASYAAGTVVSLSALPSPLSRFVGWSGACTGAAACVVTMDAAKNVTATFDVTPTYLPIIRQQP